MLRRFQPFADGMPSHDHIGDILASLDAQVLQRCFVAWVASLTGAPLEVVGHEVIAINGKTAPRSGHKKSGKLQIYMVSAFAARQRLVMTRPCGGSERDLAGAAASSLQVAIR